jgi:hypothetical protein
VPLAGARSGHRERVFMITGTGVHDRTDWPFTITGMRRLGRGRLKHVPNDPQTNAHCLPRPKGPGNDAGSAAGNRCPCGSSACSGHPASCKFGRHLLTLLRRKCLCELLAARLRSISTCAISRANWSLVRYKPQHLCRQPAIRPCGQPPNRPSCDPRDLA